jgi:hypothetical protein
VGADASLGVGPGLDGVGVDKTPDLDADSELRSETRGEEVDFGRCDLKVATFRVCMSRKNLEVCDCQSGLMGT